jgi:hypothetical protein
MVHFKWTSRDSKRPPYNHFFLIRIVEVESKLGPLGTSATKWPIVPAPGDCEDGEFGGMKTGRGNRKHSEKTCLSANLSTTNPTWPDLGSNLDRRGEKSATNRLNYGAVFTTILIVGFKHTILVLEQSTQQKFGQWLIKWKNMKFGRKYWSSNKYLFLMRPLLLSEICVLNIWHV